MDAVAASVLSCFLLGFSKGGELIGVSVPVVGECVGCGCHGWLLGTGYSYCPVFSIQANGEDFVPFDAETSTCTLRIGASAN